MARRKSSTTKNLDNSSVIVQDSPVASMRQKGNLTGNARIMRDHVFDIRNLIQAWNEELLNGTALIAEIKAVMYKKITSKTGNSLSFVSILQEPCNTMLQTCTKMEKIVEDMGRLVARIVAVCRLEMRTENSRPMFLTWSASKFVEISQQIYEMYQRELAMKTAMKDALCFCSDQDTLVFLEAAWLQEPYIEGRVNLNYEAMLQEVGLRFYEVYNRLTVVDHHGFDRTVSIFWRLDQRKGIMQEYL